jgi:hypothetical protein
LKKPRKSLLNKKEAMIFLKKHALPLVYWMANIKITKTKPLSHRLTKHRLIIISKIINFKTGLTLLDIFLCADVKIELSAKEFLLQKAIMAISISIVS